MANKQLLGKTWPIPENILRDLRATVRQFDGHGKTQGYTRCKSLLRDQSMTYEVLRRIKNWFDNNSEDKESPSYKLNGGDQMKQWVTNTLRMATNGVLQNKKVQANVGRENMYSKEPYMKVDITHRNVTQSDEAKPTLNRETKLVVKGLNENNKRVIRLNEDNIKEIVKLTILRLNKNK